MTFIQTTLQAWQSFESQKKRDLSLLSGVMFFLLMGYPFIRSTSTALFLEAHGASQSPLVWCLSVVGLSGAISLLNYWQQRLSLHRLFSITTITSLMLMIFFAAGFAKNPNFAFGLYIVKEIFIVLLVHMCIGYLNTIVSLDDARKLYGPFGAIGSLGGVIGGIGTSFLSKFYSVTTVLGFGLLLILVACLFFYHTSRKYNLNLIDKKSQTSPLASLKNIKGYVLCLILIICFSQFVINLANFKFNLLFSELIVGAEKKTQFLGQLYSALNFVSLLIQLFVVPFVLTRLSIPFLHRTVPVFYLVVSLICFGLMGHLLLGVAAGFMLFKAVDYSLFSVLKELLYFPLDIHQKYGAKYLVDMVFYRFAKGLISLYLVFMQSQFMVNLLLATSIVLWLLTLVPLIHLGQKLQAIKT